MKHIKHMIDDRHIDFSLLAIFITLSYIIIFVNQLILNSAININNIMICVVANIAIILYKKLFLLPNKFLKSYLYFIFLISMIILPSFLITQSYSSAAWQLHIFLKLYIFYMFVKYKFSTFIATGQILIITTLYIVTKNIDFLFHMLICGFFVAFNDIISFYQNKKKQVISNLQLEFQRQDTTKVESNKLENSLKTAYKLIHIISHNIIEYTNIINDELDNILIKTPKFLNIKHSNSFEQLQNSTTNIANLKNNIEVIDENILNQSHLNFADVNFKKLFYLCIENAFTKQLMLSKGILFDIKYNTDCIKFIYCDHSTVEKAINYLLDYTTKQAKKNTIVEIIIHTTSKDKLCIDISYQIENNIINYIFNKTNYTISDIECSKENIDLYMSNMLLESNFGHLLIKQNKQINNQCLEVILPIKQATTNTSTSFVRKNKLPVVICIDDDQNTLNCVELILKDSYQLINFDSPTSALSYLENPDNIVDILLIDLMMPEMYGINLIHEIKNNDLIKNVPIILNSCSSDYNEIRKAFELGITDFIQKPFNKNELLTKLDLLLKK